MMLATGHQSKYPRSKLNNHPSSQYSITLRRYNKLVFDKKLKLIVVDFVHCICFHINNYARNMEFSMLVSHLTCFPAALRSKSSNIFKLEKIIYWNMSRLWELLSFLLQYFHEWSDALCYHGILSQRIFHETKDMKEAEFRYLHNPT